MACQERLIKVHTMIDLEAGRFLVEVTDESTDDSLFTPLRIRQNPLWLRALYPPVLVIPMTGSSSTLST